MNDNPTTPRILRVPDDERPLTVTPDEQTSQELVALSEQRMNQINKRSVHRAMEAQGLRAAIRAGTELQALAFTTKASLDYRAQFKRDGKSVRDVLSQRDRAFGDYREKKE